MAGLDTARHNISVWKAPACQLAAHLEWLLLPDTGPGTGLLPDTELVELAVSLASTELCSGAPSCSKRIVTLSYTLSRTPLLTSNSISSRPSMSA